MAARLAQETDLSELRDQLASASRVAVDTEFHAERRYWPELFLVQIQVPGADAWIVDPLVEGLLPDLAEALAGVPWLVHGGSQDLRLLIRALGRLPEDIVDTQIGSGLCGERYPQGYGSLMQEHLGLTLPKSATLSDWSRRPLSREQLAYAIDDVARLPALWQAIVDKVHAADREQLLSGACHAFREASITEQEPTTAWRRFQAAAGMTPVQLAVLREVCAWRESAAQNGNVPPRAVLSDGVVVELAKRPPPTAERLLANRRFPRNARKHVPELVRCVQRGMACADPPRFVTRHTTPWRTAATLRAWSLVEGHHHQWAPNLVLPPPLIDDIVLAWPADRSALGAALGPWRDPLIGDHLWAFWSGHTSLSLANGRAQSPSAPAH